MKNYGISPIPCESKVDNKARKGRRPNKAVTDELRGNSNCGNRTRRNLRSNPPHDCWIWFGVRDPGRHAFLVDVGGRFQFRGGYFRARSLVAIQFELLSGGIVLGAVGGAPGSLAVAPHFDEGREEQLEQREKAC